MATPQTEWYIGIDLGTTFSSLSYVQRKIGGRISPVTLSFDQCDWHREVNRADLLPSFVYFDPASSEPILGRYAKYDAIRSQPQRVGRSFKLKMGDHTWRFKIEEENKEYTATELSHYVLKTLMQGLHQVRQHNIKQAIITVPASFPPEARSATEKAAEMAGIELVQLLDEPKSALFAYINQLHLEGAFENSDLFNDKIILVYDLGGGTLDISAHHVKRNTDSPFGVEIEDLVISRFTELGGDDFDRSVMEYLMNRYRKNVPELSKVDEEVPRELLIILTHHAEQLKHKLSYAIARNPDRQENETDRYIDPGVPIPGQRPLPRLSISKQEYETIIEPLLGREFGLADLDRSNQSEAYLEQKNLIVPLLDVLSKLRAKRGNVLPDVVLFHGGMSRAWFVKDRLHEFFGHYQIPFHLVSDPDRACSQGACLFHYYLSEHAENPFVVQVARSIVSDTYQLRLEREQFYPLIRAGDLLPKKETTIKGKFLVKSGFPGLHLPIIVGEKDSVIRIQEISNRYFNFEKLPTTDISVDVKYWMDENKTLSFVAVFPKNPEMKPITFEVYDRPLDQLPLPPLPPVKKRAPWIGNPSLSIEKVNEIERIALHYSSRSADEKRCVKIEKEIAFAGNRNDHFKQVTQRIRYLTRDVETIGDRQIFALKRLSILLGNLVVGVDEGLSEKSLLLLHELCCRDSFPSHDSTLYQNEFLQNVVTTLGKFEDQSSERILRTLIETEKITPGLRCSCVVPLGKVGHSESLFDFFAENLSFPANVLGNSRSYYTSSNWCSHLYWAIGKAASRKEREPSIPVGCLFQVQDQLYKQLKKGRNDHRETLRNLFFTVGEVLDHAHEGMADYTPSSREKEKFLHVMEERYCKCSLEIQEYLKKIYEIARAQIRGEPLSPEQREYREYLLSLEDRDK